jgi:exo-1,4-beta-D-glucosaminidase
MNIRQLPGAGYKPASNFSNADMPADSPFRVAWWYRKEFAVPARYAGKSLWLNFEAINYRANVWVNGKLVAPAREIAGAWRTYELDVTEAIQPGKKNAVAVEVFPQNKDDLGITFVDWNPTPPDKNMGLWRKVYLRATGPLAVRFPAVSSRLVAPANQDAELTVTAVIRNGTGKAVSGRVKGRIGEIGFETDVALGPRERRDVTFAPAMFPQLRLARPRLWWPAQMGRPELYDLEIAVEVEGKPSDWQRVPFGIREVKSALDENQRRYFTVNGKRVLIRGAGWSSDMMMREDPRRQEDELRYVLDMGLNTVRLEGKIESDHFLDFADRQGILVMAGWCCCDHWEKWKNWKAEDHVIAAESQRDQLYRLRAHPSVFAWLNASDMPPPAAVEQRYLQVAEEVRWPNPILSSAAAKKAEHSGVSGVKMHGPYEWVPPRYWLEDSRRGGAYGFNTETSPGPAVPPIESLRKMLPASKLWPINEYWDFHAGGQEFANIRIHTAALEARYGKASSAEDYAFKSQLVAYEGIRAMFEAFSRNKYRATGIIQWMLNNAWPGIIWHLYDYYLLPGGGYFGAKKSNETLHPIYSYTDGSIWAVNSSYQPQGGKGWKLVAKVWNLDMTEKFTQEAPVDLAPDESKILFTLPDIKDLSPTYFIDLRIVDGAGKVLGSSFYWQSTKPDRLDHDKGKWFVTPTTEYADFTALSGLPKVKLKVHSKSARLAAVAGQGEAHQGATAVTLSNPSKSLAFFVRLKVTRGRGGDEVLPVLWEDNYVSLLPGETRQITARYRWSDLGGKRPEVELHGWNLAGWYK